MSEEMQIEVVTYERERLDYFTELMQLARTRYSLLYHKFKDAPYMSKEHQMLSDMGREVQFFGDVVEMLENGYRKQSEGEWISVEERLPERELQELMRMNPLKVFPCLVVITSDYYNKAYVSQAYYAEEGFISGDSGLITERITHWMPLPEPPDMKGGAE